jgi:hypothetical protein
MKFTPWIGVLMGKKLEVEGRIKLYAFGDIELK